VSELYDAAALARLAADIDGWLTAISRSSPVVRAVDRADGDDVRWFVRMAGEEKDVITVWMMLGQRTLRYETYLMPAPAENAAVLYEQLLRRNERLIGAHFSIGVEDAIFLRGELPLAAVTAAELDRAIGTLFATVEQIFGGLVRVGFASHFAHG
jgi:Putative bacterial sensory transduction regulator